MSAKHSISLVLSVLVLSAVLTLSHVLLRSASVHQFPEYPWMIRVFTALFLYALVFFVYTVLLKYFDISVLYPAYTALSIVGVTIAGIMYFGEAYTAYKMLGIVTLIVGVVLVSL